MSYTIFLAISSLIISAASADSHFQNEPLKAVQSNLSLPEDVGLTISDFLTKYGYTTEEHTVETEDGFLLTLNRIPSRQPGGPAVLFVHGFLCSGFDWVSQGSNNSLALLLYDLGYDIWLYNARGTHYSIQHKTLNSTEQEYWDYTFHEKGIYDLTATINYALEVVNQTDLTMIAHSQGTSSSMALLSTLTEYNDKVNLLMLMSPIGYMGGVTSSIPLWLADHITEVVLALDVLKVYGYPYTGSISEVIAVVCSIDGLTEVCVDFLGLLCGYDSEQADLEYVQLFVSDKPSGGSVKELRHYGQEMLAASFRRFDYGTLGNVAQYGSIEPPVYDPSLITAPVVAYYGKNDFLAAVEDVERLLDQIPNKEAHLIEYEYFNHLDFLIAKDVRTMVYDNAIEIIKKNNAVPIH